jgi:hypothetical protein
LLRGGIEEFWPIPAQCDLAIVMNSVFAVQPRLHCRPVAAAEQNMNPGEIRVFRFEYAQSGAETIATNFGVDAPTQLIVVDEEIPIIINVLTAIAHQTPHHRR